MLRALREYYKTGSEKYLDSYQTDAYRRIWKAANFSYFMTTMLHMTPDATEFDKQRQLAELYSYTTSDYGQLRFEHGIAGGIPVRRIAAGVGATRRRQHRHVGVHRRERQLLFPAARRRQIQGDCQGDG